MVSVSTLDSRGCKETRFTCRLPTADKVKQLMIFAQGPCQCLNEHQLNIEVIGSGHKELLCTLSKEKKCFQWFEEQEKVHVLPSSKGTVGFKYVMVATLSEIRNGIDKDKPQLEPSTDKTCVEESNSKVSEKEEQFSESTKEEEKREESPKGHDKQTVNKTCESSENKPTIGARGEAETQNTVLSKKKSSKKVDSKIKSHSVGSDDKPCKDITNQPCDDGGREAFSFKPSKNKEPIVKACKVQQPKGVMKKVPKRTSKDKLKQSTVKSKDISSYFTGVTNKQTAAKVECQPSGKQVSKSTQVDDEYIESDEDCELLWFDLREQAEKKSHVSKKNAKKDQEKEWKKSEQVAEKKGSASKKKIENVATVLKNNTQKVDDKPIEIDEDCELLCLDLQEQVEKKSPVSKRNAKKNQAKECEKPDDLEEKSEQVAQKKGSASKKKIENVATVSKNNTQKVDDKPIEIDEDCELLSLDLQEQVEKKSPVSKRNAKKNQAKECEKPDDLEEKSEQVAQKKGSASKKKIENVATVSKNNTQKVDDKPIEIDEGCELCLDLQEQTEKKSPISKRNAKKDQAKESHPKECEKPDDLEEKSEHKLMETDEDCELLCLDLQEQAEKKSPISKRNAKKDQEKECEKPDDLEEKCGQVAQKKVSASSKKKIENVATVSKNNTQKVDEKSIEIGEDCELLCLDPQEQAEKKSPVSKRNAKKNLTKECEKPNDLEEKSEHKLMETDEDCELLSLDPQEQAEKKCPVSKRNAKKDQAKECEKPDDLEEKSEHKLKETDEDCKLLCLDLQKQAEKKSPVSKRNAKKDQAKECEKPDDLEKSEQVAQKKGAASKKIENVVTVSKTKRGKPEVTVTEDESEHVGPTVLTSLSNTPETNKLSQSEQMQIQNETTPPEPVHSAQSPFPTPKVSRKRKNNENTPTPKSRRQKIAMRALTEKTPPPAKTSLMDLPNRSLYEDPVISPLKEASDNKKVSRCVDLSARVPKPSSRWGHTLTLVSSESAILIGGQGEKQLSRDSIWSLNPEMRTWKSPEVVTEGAKPEYRVGHTATYDPTMRCIYVYGGSKNAKWFHDVHIFDLDENKWTLVKANGKAPTRAYHSTTLFRHEMWIFGGVFPRPDPQPDGCDNDVHIYSPVMESWYKPIVTGEKPRPRSGHSGTCINDLLVVFGGWDFPYCYNDICILDLTTVDWSSPEVHGAPPKPRSWHASCALTNNRLFIHGGYDGDNALHDAHIFDMGSHTWQELVLDNAPSARAGHKCLLLPSDYEDLEEDEVIVFGGGDNDGSYFSDMLSFYVPFDPKTL